MKDCLLGKNQILVGCFLIKNVTKLYLIVLSQSGSENASFSKKKTTSRLYKFVMEKLKISSSTSVVMNCIDFPIISMFFIRILIGGP